MNLHITSEYTDSEKLFAARNRRDNFNRACASNWNHMVYALYTSYEPPRKMRIR